jgi:hypothetical protein
MGSYPLSNVPDPYSVLTEAQRYQIIPPTDPWTNSYALTIVSQSINYMENFIQASGHLNRWRQADEMLAGWRPQKKWENSQKLRARVPVFLLFSQLQALLPNVLQAIFPLHENVDVAPRPGSTMENAREAADLIMAQLDSLGEEGLTRFYSIAMDCFNQGFLYGCGILEITWLFKMLEKLACMVSWEPPMQQVFDSLTNQMLNVPVGEPRRVVHEMVQRYIVNQPHIQNLDVRDFLIDPHCRTPRVQDARMCAARSYPTVGELIQYRNQAYFQIPDDKTLIELAMAKTANMMENAKRGVGMWGSGWNISDDYSTDPYQLRLELYRWFSRDRCVWLLNRTWVAYNRANIYQFLPFLNAFYVPFPNRFHGLSLADITEGNQNLIASLKEARMDELSLAMNAPFIRRNGTMLGSPGTLPMSPAKVIDVNDEPEKSLMRLEVQAQTQEAFLEAADAERQTAKDTGLSDLAVMGVPSAGGNSANRTATGVEKQTAAAGVRIQFLVENLESSLIEPMCSILHQFNIKFLPRDQLVPITGMDGQQRAIDPVRVLNAMPRFTMRASSRMRARATLQQVLPWLVQTVLNPEVLGMMGKQLKKKLKLMNLMQLITDTMNIPKIDLWEDMTPQEIQEMSQPDPKSMMDLQKQRERMQAMGEMQQDQGDTELLNTLANRLVTPRAAEDFLGFSDPQHMQSQAALIKAHQRPRANGNGQR